MSQLKKALQKNPVGRAIAERYDLVKGAYTYHTKPNRRGSPEIAFNDQHGRQAIFNALIGAIDFAAILETGTYLGRTTEYMHTRSDLDVYTTEANPKFYAFSKQRFKSHPRIHLTYSDSREFLKNTIKPLNAQDKPLFFYLDAHWEEDLPLREEVDIIFNLHPRSVILIDDFKVDDDPVYGYDDYGNGKTLHLPYFDPINHHPFRAFFPALPGEEESGAKRGSVTLAMDDDLSNTISTLAELREYSRHPVSV